MISIERPAITALGRGDVVLGMAGNDTTAQ